MKQCALCRREGKSGFVEGPDSSLVCKAERSCVERILKRLVYLHWFPEPFRPDPRDPSGEQDDKMGFHSKDDLGTCWVCGNKTIRLSLSWEWWTHYTCEEEAWRQYAADLARSDPVEVDGEF